MHLGGGPHGEVRAAAGFAADPETPPQTDALESVPSWVFDVKLPDPLVRALVAAYRFGGRGQWHASRDSAVALGVTERSLRRWCSVLVRLGYLRKMARATYRMEAGDGVG